VCCQVGGHRGEQLRRLLGIEHRRPGRGQDEVHVRLAGRADGELRASPNSGIVTSSRTSRPSLPTENSSA
jgi:hypothetical protein